MRESYLIYNQINYKDMERVINEKISVIRRQIYLDIYLIIKYQI